MLFQDATLLVISDDAAFLDVVKTLPYNAEILSDVTPLLKKTRYLGGQVVLFDVTTANIDTDAVFQALLPSNSLIIVGTHAEMDLIVHYLALSRDKATNYLIKPTVTMLLQHTIKHTYDGQELAAFMGLIGHDFKSPLSSIRGYSEILLQKRFDEAQQTEALQLIKTNADRMDRLINHLVIAVRLERSRMGLLFDKYPPIRMVQAAVKQIAKQIEDKRQTLHVNIADNCPRVWSDSSYLQTVLTSLLENASEYTYPEGQITLSAVAEDGFVKFSVQDTGIGIHEDDKPHIFELYYRSRDEQVSMKYGYGMSLYNARNIVLAHKGKMWFESEYGKGSTFYFTIPIAAS